MLKLLDEGIDGYPHRGTWDKSNQKEAAIYISMEARRLGYSSAKTMDMILGWNRKKNHPSIAKTMILTDVVCYVYEQNPPPELGCKGELVKKGYCLLNRGQQCQYWEQLTRRQKLPDKWDINDFDRFGWPEHLRKCYKNGELAIRTHEAIRISATERQLGQEDPIMIGFRSIRRMILRLYKDTDPSPMAISSAVHTLEDCGLIHIPERGTAGQFSRKSNAYQIIYPIPKVPQPLHSIDPT